MRYMGENKRLARWMGDRSIRMRGATALAILVSGGVVGTVRSGALGESVPPAERVEPVAAQEFRAATASAGESGAVTWDLPNLDHPRVDDFVEVFTGRKRAEFGTFLARMGQYQPMISAKLEERGMPQDLIYLAMIESGFDPKAYSHAHASGLWQFISGTGTRYGLDINRAVDERRDPEKATDAALDYLTDLHRRFGSWYLAAAAYNTGEGRVQRIMREETGSREAQDEYAYYRIAHRLPRETRDYVPLMVAAARIAKEPQKYGFENVRPLAPAEAATVEVAPATPLSAIARAAGTTAGELRELNPQLKLARTRNDEPSEIRIPAEAKESFALGGASAR